MFFTACWLNSYIPEILYCITNVLVIDRSNISPKNSYINTTSLDINKITTYVPVTSRIPAVWLTEPSVTGTTHVYSPVGDV